MSDTSTAGVSGRAGALRRPVVVAIAGVAAVLIGATLALWALLGPAVFYEVILAGIAACF
ncbi:hypothetical protein PQJ75_01495 [Rhodoplanes sp. TEM]|uniref:Uncharacterized protein n=1 Tax=Rhodoplanes tepidamans TaxID=200616 RepID=A0ABT5J9A3_RHOTP|nr:MULTISPECIES: hypothetical protein [Rhodoplanes]MDC7786235.1 hypothetical protein [Rhodoplanes tepidamans]MDC7982394.1 hypothetical protein [Rhodoplanes sp. TEM]MDQ0355034.1 hypothetical protein [Rhodoplanes tepidamans]